MVRGQEEPWQGKSQGLQRPEELAVWSWHVSPPL